MNQSSAIRRILKKKIWFSNINLYIVPILFFLIAILAYGLRIRQLGFYWDDWPWIWLYHQKGLQRLLVIDQVSRPLAGEVLAFGAILASTSPLGWQIINIVYRLLTAFTLFWTLSQLWPSKREKVVWMCLLFLVYPSFRQQFVSINSSRHLLPFSLTFLSFLLMILAIRNHHRLFADNSKNIGIDYGVKTVVALVLMTVSMLTTEYYYGLELIRPFMIWFVLDDIYGKNCTVKKVLLNWLPYLMVMAGIFTWRFLVSPHGNYPIVMTDMMVEQPIQTIYDVLERIGHATYSTVILAWQNLFDPDLFFGLTTRFGYYILVGCSIVVITLILFIHSDRDSKRKFNFQVIGLGLFALLIAPLPFLIAGIKIDLEFPADRATLPLIFGASLLLIGLLNAIIKWRYIKILIISIVTSIAIGMHFLTANSYEKSWQIQKSFFHQLMTRAPALQPGTTIFYEYTTALQNSYFTDNSLKAALNWVYSPDLTGPNIPYDIIDLRLRDKYHRTKLDEASRLIDRYGEYKFVGSYRQILPIQFAPPTCLKVLEPQFKGLYPHLPMNLSRNVRFANLDLIDFNDRKAQWLDEVFGTQPEDKDWCSYYQKAELARQMGDWQKILDIDQIILGISAEPEQAIERLPFIIANGMTSNWQRAVELTLETYTTDKDTIGLLCEVWRELKSTTPVTPTQKVEVASALLQLNCP